ncbi:MAG: sugar phosphate isomerase/epimerase [Lentisphaerae bacterium]|nr:sugar phosphate isomerase/epimerase [Lentisphaerota bacterium]
MQPSFMTLGCPAWDIDAICRNGHAMGFAGVDFRGLGEQLDITVLPAFTTHLDATRRQLGDAGLAVSGISTSIQVCDRNVRAKSLEEAKRTIPVALALGARQVRVFGGGNLEANPRPDLADIGAACMAEILSLEGANRLHWLFETHDLWIRGADCRLLLDRIPNPAFGALWDMGHTYRVGGETPEESYAAIGSRVGYTHVKDAVLDGPHPSTMKDGWRYVAPGEGALPLAHSVHLLRQGGYDGWLVFEHEKRWIPALPEPEDMFPAFMRWYRKLMAG